MTAANGAFTCDIGGVPMVPVLDRAWDDEPFTIWYECRCNETREAPPDALLPGWWP